MKQVKRFGFATALLCITALLIAAFMVLFSYSGCTPNDKSKETLPNKLAGGEKTNNNTLYPFNKYLENTPDEVRSVQNITADNP
jgi:hypothetical protein